MDYDLELASAEPGFPRRISAPLRVRRGDTTPDQYTEASESQLEGFSSPRRLLVPVENSHGPIPGCRGTHWRSRYCSRRRLRPLGHPSDARAPALYDSPRAPFDDLRSWCRDVPSPPGACLATRDR